MRVLRIDPAIQRGDGEVSGRPVWAKPSVCQNSSFARLGWIISSFSHGLRHGLYSFAAARLDRKHMHLDRTDFFPG